MLITKRLLRGSGLRHGEAIVLTLACFGPSIAGHQEMEKGLIAPTCRLVLFASEESSWVS